MDKQFMTLAIAEARKGIGKTSPNPSVGAVIVKEGEVIAKGYHEKAGMAHAEVRAIENAGCSLKGATIYVTLEPCSHTGKTPPCCRALVENGFARVVIGMLDPNPLVNGRGIQYLQDHGVEVESGVLAQECEALNYPFIKHIRSGLPWVIMKAGISLDGRINYQQGKSGWITGEAVGYEVHKIRDSVDAIMVGSNTVKIDNPSLTTRLPGNQDGKDPIRIVIDSNLSLSPLAKIFNLNSKAPTWVICSTDVTQQQIEIFLELGVKLIQVTTSENGLDLNAALLELGKEDVCSVLVEGGSALHGSLLREQLYDYAHLFYAPIFAGDAGVSLVSGVSVKGKEGAPRLISPQWKQLGEDLQLSGRLAYGR